jgi:hypothetical protein
VKIQKWNQFAIILLLAISSCIELSISDQEAGIEFEELNLQPLFGDLLSDSNSIHYAYITSSKESLVIFIHGSPDSWGAFVD